MAKTLDEIMAEEQPENIIYGINSVLLDRITDWDSHLDSLTKEEQTLFLICGLEGEVNNGGFAQFFFNSSGDYSQETLAALNAIHADLTAHLLRQAMTIFPGGMPPADQDDRNALIDLMGDDEETLLGNLDDQFYEGKENLSDLLLIYVKEHKDRFLK